MLCFTTLSCLLIMHSVSSRRQSPKGESGTGFSVKLRSTKSRNLGSATDDANAPAGEMFSVKLRSTKSRAGGSPSAGAEGEGGNRFSVKLRSTKTKNSGPSPGQNEGREGEMFKVKLKKTKRGGEARTAEDNNAGVPKLAGFRKKKKKQCVRTPHTLYLVTRIDTIYARTITDSNNITAPYSGSTPVQCSGVKLPELQPRTQFTPTKKTMRRVMPQLLHPHLPRPRLRRAQPRNQLVRC